MSAWNHLVQFARAHRGELTLSAYVAASTAAAGERCSWMVVLRQQLDGLQRRLERCSAEEHAVFAACVERLFLALPTTGALPRDHGLAFFTSADGDALRLELPRGLETSVHWGLGPRVAPLSRFAEPDDAWVTQLGRHDEDAAASRGAGVRRE